MKYTEIDGKRLEVRTCEECPFGGIDEGWSDYCGYPGVGRIVITLDGIIPEECPLREVRE